MSSQDSFSHLVDQAIAGDRSALSQLLLIHYDELSRRVNASMTRDLQSLVRAEDILQQTFVNAAKSIRDFQPTHPGAFRGWLGTIAGNLLRDAERRRQRERRARYADQGVGFSGDGAAIARRAEQLPGDQTTPSRRARVRESLKRMQSAMARLPKEHQEVIQRRYLHGDSLEEIAQSMGCSKEAVRGICYRARKSLRASMGRTSMYFSG